jgi:CMP/dCMP kinase
VPTITISREYGSGGDEIALRVTELLGYRYFDKRMMEGVATQFGLTPCEIVELSEDQYRARSLVGRLFGSQVPGAEIRRRRRNAQGLELEDVDRLTALDCVGLMRAVIRAVYRRGNVVIVGRGAQVILEDMPGVLHVRIEEPLDARVRRVQEVENLSPGDARRRVAERDSAAAGYLQQFYHVDWADARLYQLILNTGKWDGETAAEFIVHAAKCLAGTAEVPASLPVQIALPTPVWA